MCTCTIDIASESLNLSYNCVYFFSRAGPPNSLSRRASGGSPRPRIARAARGFLYAAVIAVRLAMAAAGMGPRPPLATSTRGRPHQAAPACAPQQQVQPNRSTAQPQFRHRPTTQGQLRHCGPPWLHGGTIPAPNPVCSASARAMCQSKRQAKAASNSAAGVQWPQCHVLVPGTGQAGSTSTCTAMARLHEPVPAMIMTRDPAG